MLTLKRLLSLLTIILSFTLSSCGGGGGSGSGGGSGGGDTLYTLTFYDGDDRLTDLTIREPYGTEITLPTLPAKGDYIFHGWVKNSIGGIIKSDADSPITGSYTVTANVIFYAKWTKETPAPKYTVTFYDGGVLLPQFSQTVENGTEITLPPLVSACSPFEGWLVNGSVQPPIPDYAVNANLRFDAKFTDLEYIRTPEELNSISLSGKYRLTNNISLSDYSTGWTPIGDAANPFIGCLDGNGFKVTELYVDVSGSGGEVFAGLFGYIFEGEISNIGVEADSRGVNGNNSSINGYSYAGIIAGYVSNGTITDSYATGDVTATSSYAYAGGLVGWIDGGSITNSYATGDVTATSSSSYSYSFAGGLVGGMNYGSITDSYATGDVTATATSTDSSYSLAGGLVGYMSGNITDSYATGDVTATSSSSTSSSNSYAGGLVGWMNDSSSITDSYTTGDVSATAIATDRSYSYAGGLVGFMRSSSITNSYATGAVTATSTSYSYAGGLVGRMDEGSITDSVAANLIVEITQGTGYMGRIVGGIYSGGSGTVTTNNFAYEGMEPVGAFGTPPANNGEDKTDTQLKDQSTYEGLGWEFGNSGEAIWKMPSGGGYPILYWQ